MLSATWNGRSSLNRRNWIRLPNKKEILWPDLKLSEYFHNNSHFVIFVFNLLIYAGVLFCNNINNTGSLLFGSIFKTPFNFFLILFIHQRLVSVIFQRPAYCYLIQEWRTVGFIYIDIFYTTNKFRWNDFWLYVLQDKEKYIWSWKSGKWIWNEKSLSVYLL